LCGFFKEKRKKGISLSKKKRSTSQARNEWVKTRAGDARKQQKTTTTTTTTTTSTQSDATEDDLKERWKRTFLE